MTEFSVVKISSAAFENAEEIEGGAAEKYRVNLPDIPAATYEFAELFDERRAIVSPNYLLPNHDERSGKSLLDGYFGQGNYLYTLDTVFTTIDVNEIEVPSGYNLFPQVKTATDLLIGYLIFDYWIDNIDRHYENWGIQIDSVTGRKELLPTYDHGLSLGFLLFDEECLDLAPANHVQNQSSAFSGNKGRSLSMNGMLVEVISIKPDLARVWIERIAQVNHNDIIELFERIPEGWISNEKKLFAIDLLEFNRQQLMLLY
jgi:hypothetical protein